MTHPQLADPFVKSVIDDAVEPFAKRLLPEELAWLTDQLAVLMAADPEIATLLQGAHPRAIDTSGERGPLGIDEPSDGLPPALDPAAGGASK